jgi:GNAT superfamily N-acetyltransferase
MLIRPYHAADEAAVIDLWRQCGLLRSVNNPRKDIRRKLNINGELFLVGVIDNQIMASVMAGYDGHRGAINYVAVHPAHRRKGYGRAIMAEAERLLVGMGCPKINLQVRVDNPSVIEFYQRIGYAVQTGGVPFGKRLENDEHSLEAPPSRGSDEWFLEQFESRQWPLAQWHHRQHIKLAYLYLRRYSFDEATTRIRAGIQSYNAANKIPDTPTSGYHETMTQAWLRLVDFALRENGPAESADHFFDAHPELWQSKTLRLFYSRDRFMSAEAKQKFIEPDLAPFPVARRK